MDVEWTIERKDRCSKMFKWFLTGEDQPRIKDPARIKTMYRSARFQAVTAMIIGSQLFLSGFIGELISRNSPNRNNYKIEQEI